jgi:hypothetical protein
MNPDRRDQSEGVKSERRISGLPKGPRSEMPSLHGHRVEANFPAREAEAPERARDRA